VPLCCKSTLAEVILVLFKFAKSVSKTASCQEIQLDTPFAFPRTMSVAAFLTLYVRSRLYGPEWSQKQYRRQLEDG
jgi:hypothetical protein